MRKIIAAFVVVVSVAGCGQSKSGESAEPQGKTAAPLATADLVGRWQFVFTDEVRARYRAKIATKISDPVELEKAMKDADEESRASELEFTEGSVFISRVLGEEILRRPYAPRVASPTSLVLDDGDEHKEIVFIDHDTISIDEPAKGHLIYTRVN